MWAWVYTDEEIRHKYPIIAVDESKKIMAEEKAKHLKGQNPEHGRLLRKLYRKSKVVPVTITYEI